ncbi:sigma-54 interaction domain-containing protein [Pelagibaculum spongiae]|uniref:Sigma-54 factor interaction domain-containing protein n=1 Tax=Pelagibaculum spongiae TaxID=2080658 RepID=A0A2V1GRI9_9GAMM|nr:sigma-54 dependent transcriptional regulator [Pelagibaculum spongiae]PVZ66383.1 hypothetical protein DC094_16955 [Pelagibaculum spongiae]
MTVNRESAKKNQANKNAKAADPLFENSLQKQQLVGEQLSSWGRFMILFGLIPILVLRLYSDEIRVDYLPMALGKWLVAVAYAVVIRQQLKNASYQSQLGYLTLFIDSLIVTVSLISMSFYKTNHLGTLNDSLYVVFYILALGSALRFDARYSLFSCSLAIISSALLIRFDMHFHQMPADLNLFSDRVLSLVALTVLSIIFARKLRYSLLSEYLQKNRHLQGIAALIRINSQKNTSAVVEQQLKAVVKEAKALTRSDFSYLMLDHSVCQKTFADSAPEIGRLKTIPLNGLEQHVISDSSVMNIFSRQSLQQQFHPLSIDHLLAQNVADLIALPICMEQQNIGVLVIGRKSAKAGDRLPGVLERQLASKVLLHPVLRNSSSSIPKQYDDYELLLLKHLASHITQLVTYQNLQNQLKQITDEAAESPLEKHNQANSPPAISEFCGMLGQSQPMQLVYQNIKRVAVHDVAVLIQGQSGTGKELAAKALHQLSARSDQPFVMLNCAAIPENLLESELFGYVKGAFSGATRNKRGLFESADKGTIFLDEIGDMLPALQSKLLRVIQQGELVKLGSERTINVDVRVITATHQNLEQQIADGQFREDLYFRINQVAINLPPLSQRETDISLLAQSFLKQLDQDRYFTDSALKYLQQKNWPGNIRQLKSLVQQLIVLTDQQRIDPALIQNLEQQQSHQVASTEPLNAHIQQTLADGCQLKNELQRYEKQLLEAALQKADGNLRDAASLLGTAKSTLFDKVRRYQL